MGGFAKVEKMLKFLKVPKLFLFPRFHSVVKDDLDAASVAVEEVQVAMSNRMKMIQLSLVELMESTLKELLRLNQTSLEVPEMLTLQITESLEMQIRRQLDPIWHRVSLKSKQLISELRVLRVLLDYLIACDAITFCRYLETLVLSDSPANCGGGFRSYWLMTDTANTMIQMAKDRVFLVVPSDGSIKANVERLPKWKALEAVLKGFPDKRIIIMVREESTRRILSKIITLGYEAWQEAKFEAFLAWRRRARQQSGSSNVGIPAGNASEKNAPDGIARPRSKPNLRHRPSPVVEKVKDVNEEGEEEFTSASLQEDYDDLDDAVQMPEGLSIHCYGEEDVGDDYAKLLERTSPDVVILYDGDLAMIRSLEVYSSTCESFVDKQLIVNLLIYKDSVDEERQLSAIRQEKEAFEALIKAKAVRGKFICQSFIIYRVLEHGSDSL